MKIRSHTIFILLALSGILLLFIFAYLTQKQLENGTNAKENVTEFFYYNSYLTHGNSLLFVLLIFVANIMYIRNRYWDTFIWAGIIFVAYTLADWWWLSEMVFRYKKANDLWMGEFSLGPFMGILIAIFGLTLAIANYLLLKRILKEKGKASVEKEVEDKE